MNALGRIGSRISYILLCAATWLALTSFALGHGLENESVEVDPTRLWSWEPGVVLPLALSALLYILGFQRLCAEGRAKRFRFEAMMFFLGWLFLVAALVSPIHRLGGFLFSVHMIQHELLMVAAAPLLILGRPGLVMLKAFPPKKARPLTMLASQIGATSVWNFCSMPIVAWTIHAAALWCWHIPALFQSTLRNEWVHAAQHVSFFVTALWFWESIFRGPRRAGSYGIGILNLFTTAVHTSVLGALITFAPSVWYPAYGARPTELGFSPIEDQQLGGLIMWVPAGLVYIIAALALFGGWIRHRDPKSEHLSWGQLANNKP